MKTYTELSMLSASRRSNSNATTCPTSLSSCRPVMHLLASSKTPPGSLRIQREAKEGIDQVERGPDALRREGVQHVIDDLPRSRTAGAGPSKVVYVQDLGGVRA
eukprot:3849537-Pyramimonas_sp.AAC.1